MESEQSTTPATPEVDNSGPLSMDDAVQAYLDRTDSTPAKGDAKPQVEEAPAEQVTEAAPDTEQAEADATDVVASDVPSEEYEFDLAGHKFRMGKDNLKEVLPQVQAKAKELESGAQRKFQEAAEARKHADEFGQLVAQNAELFGEFKSVSAELQHLHSLDLEAMSDSDPVRAQKAAFRLMQLQQRHGNLQQQLQQADAQMKQSRAQANQKAVDEVRQYAQTSIKGWSQDLDRALGDYVVKNRVKSDSVSALTTDPALYELAVKAYKYDTLQATKPIAEKKVQDAPKTLKPNSTNTTVTSAQVRARDAWGKFEKSGSMDDAVEAYLARQKVRK